MAQMKEESSKRFTEFSIFIRDFPTFPQTESSKFSFIILYQSTAETIFVFLKSVRTPLDFLVKILTILCKNFSEIFDWIFSFFFLLKLAWNSNKKYKKLIVLTFSERKSCSHHFLSKYLNFSHFDDFYRP